MKKVSLIISIFFIIIFDVKLRAQSKNASIQNSGNLIYSKLLVGKWQSENDKEYMLVFGKQKYVELYGKDTTDNMYYKLSGSCNLKDSTSVISLKNAYLLLYYNVSSIQQCNVLLNLKSNILSWTTDNGKIYVFKKIK